MILIVITNCYSAHQHYVTTSSDIIMVQKHINRQINRSKKYNIDHLPFRQQQQRYTITIRNVGLIRTVYVIIMTIL